MDIRTRQIVYRAGIKKERILPLLQREDSILDIGSGNGGLYHLLQQEGYNITPLDIKDKSKIAGVRPIIYDGKRLPYSDNTFDTSLLITMLHHTPDPEMILQEAKRVSRRRLIIMEDIYTNVIQQRMTYFTDSLVNWEWKGHPHSNRTAEEWEKLFEEMNLRLLYKKEFSFLIFFRQVIYVLEK